ncbi:MAG: hypothetical protein Q4B33_07085 [Fusobacterium sp.]|nr:hypothetical protein [Fusobacterium sp.]
MKNLIKILFILMIGVNVAGAEEKPVIPMVPMLPAVPQNAERVPIETKTVFMGMKTEIVVPLEIISDVEIQAMVIDDQEIEVPFEIEFNKMPDKDKTYKIGYTETEIDIDKDGKTDTYIYSNDKVDSKILTGNKVVIQGKNISKEGYHEKVVYINVETHN